MDDAQKNMDHKVDSLKRVVSLFINYAACGPVGPQVLCKHRIKLVSAFSDLQSKITGGYRQAGGQGTMRKQGKTV